METLYKLYLFQTSTLARIPFTVSVKVVGVTGVVGLVRILSKVCATLTTASVVFQVSCSQKCKSLADILNVS